jgi:hypothetical protein
MAVELAKVSLWINSAVEDKPLNFLDHHIKCGNSLIGTNSELVEGEFPVDAYETSGGRDWHVGNKVRKRIRSENRERAKGSSESSLREWDIGREYVDIAEQIEEIEEQGAEDIRKKKQLYDELRESDPYQQEKLAYDAWTAAFYWPMDKSADEYPSPSIIDKLRRNSNSNSETFQNLAKRATEIAEQQNFFHWELEFPEIFSGTSSGFDCILGNPPWDKVKLEEKEWFAGRAPSISESDSKEYRTRLINELEDSNPELYSQWKLASRRSSQTSKFIRESGRYPLSGSGEINTYPVFTELTGTRLVNDNGRTGIIVKTGLATDYRTQDLFGKFVEDNQLVTLYDFVNKEGLFPDVAPPERFCLLTISGSDVSTKEAKFSFFNTNLEMMRDESRRYGLSKEQIENINPNTRSCPAFESKRIRDIAVDIYSKYPVLINEQQGRNTWDITYHTLFHMTNDTDIFESNTLENLQEQGYVLSGNKFKKGERNYYPLYEAKFLHQFDHRFGTFEGVSQDSRFTRRASTEQVSENQKSDPEFQILPRYWVYESDFEDQAENIDWSEDWIFAYRKVVRTTTDFRTAVGTIMPYYPLGNSAAVLTFDCDSTEERALLFTSLFTSFVFDFVLRQSVGGANLNLYILKQLPMPTPSCIEEYYVEKNGQEESLKDFLISRALRLCWTSGELNCLGNEIEPNGSPYDWNQQNRRVIRAEIDAAVAHLYDISQEDFRYIINQFDILKERQKSKYGYYRRKEECMCEFEDLDVYRRND